MTTAAPEPVIAVEHITQRFPGVVALDDVSFAIAAGEVHAICGENGAGKSTLMKIIAGVVTDFSGNLRIRGKSVRFTNTRAAEQAGISIIHQELNLVEQLSAAANIFLGRERRSLWGTLDHAAMNDAAAELLTELDGEIDPATTVAGLRVGDQQLVEIAKALSLHSDILIMDEPTSALTETEVARLFRIVDRLRARGVTILYISHKMDEIFQLADSITVLRDGRHIRTSPRSATSRQEITHLMVGREIEATQLAARPTTDDVLVDVEHLSLPWPGHARGWRLREISFTLRRGEILGIAGLMGAGRTELLECLFGASVEPPTGAVRLAGARVRFRTPAEARQAGVALVTEDRKRLGIFDQLSVGENITLCELRQATRAGLIDFVREQQLAERMISQLRVKTASATAPITTLSGGNQQKAIIARWLLTNPRLLLLDDPTRGIDVGAKAELYRLFDELCRAGLGIIVTSGELPELLTLCDRILVLCEGRLTGEFTRATASEAAIMEAATRREPTELSRPA